MILQELFRDIDQVVTLTENDRIRDAAELMRGESIGCVVIVEKKQIIGIITDRDIALGVTLGVATPESFVTEVMTRDVKVVYESMTLFDVSRIFRKACVKRLPVIDQDKNLVGIVSVDDVMALLSREMFDTCSSLTPKLGHMV